jgi:hypothetical protein
MKAIRYALLISVVVSVSLSAVSQTQPADSSKRKKSSPVPSRPITPPPGSSVTQPQQQSSAPVSTGTGKKSSPVTNTPARPATPSNNINNSSNPRVSTPAPAAPVSASSTSVKQTRADQDVMNGILSIGAIAGVPQGEFAQQTNDAWGWGVDISMLFNIATARTKREWQRNPVNVYVGGAFQYISHGGKTDKYSYNDQFSETTINSKVNNNMYGINVLVRSEFLTGPVKPFLEMTGGVRFFSGSHKIEYENSLYNSTDPNNTRRQTFSNNLGTSPVGFYGAGGGFRIGGENIRLEIKLMYTKGFKAEYVDLDKISFDRADNSITYETKKSTTDMVIPQIGLSINF